MPYNSFYEEILRNKIQILLCKVFKIYDAICSIVLRRGILIRCAILVYIYVRLFLNKFVLFPGTRTVLALENLGAATELGICSNVGKTLLKRILEPNCVPIISIPIYFCYKVLS